MMLAKRLSCFFEDEGGATAIEYALIAGIVSVSIVFAASALGLNLSNTFTGLSGNLSN